MAKPHGIAYLGDQSGQSGNRSIEPGARAPSRAGTSFCSPRGASSDETARSSVTAASCRAQNVAERLSTCSVCGNVDTADPCSICRDPRRDEKMLCVVEEVADLWALDRSRLFPGRYHVLGGRLSALEGVGPDDLSIDQLVRRVSEGGIDEVVLAMNATLEGQTTAHYVAERLEGFPIRISQLAHGLPVGGELDYLDEGTLAQALRARRPIS